MTNEQYAALNGEQLLHTVWILRNGRPVGLMHQTIDDIAKMLATHQVIKIECVGYTLEAVKRDIAKWGA